MTQESTPGAGAPGTETGGSFEVLRRRLDALGAQVRVAAEGLNAARVAEYGDSRLSLLGRAHIRTAQASVGRDLVQVGDVMLFGFNVTHGLKARTELADVFALYRLTHEGGAFDVQPAALEGSFLTDPAFVRDFEELYAYYRHARLLQLEIRAGRLLASFQIGERLTDRRVFRWDLTGEGARYLDARGERDLSPLPPFDFEWTRAGRDQEVSGRFPHLNILDTLFVETAGGTLTVKVENNTETGEGIYSEPVEERTQGLDDATFEFARVGRLILLRVLPYREKTWRGLIFDTLTGRVTREDAVTRGCVQLPEEHGIVFPGGYYLPGGEHRAFEGFTPGMALDRVVRSPNGEDVLFVFYDQDSGRSAFLVYNLIRREVQTPISAHGDAALPDGRMVLFQAEAEPTQVHAVQVWQTPFTSDVFAAQRPPGTSFLGRLGNAELVRGVSNLFALARAAQTPEVTAAQYAALAEQARRLPDTHHWLDDEHAGGARTLLRDVTAAAEAVLDEFEKVQALRAQAAQTLADVQGAVRRRLTTLNPEGWRTLPEFVTALAELTALRARLLTVRDTRYIDLGAVDALLADVQAAHARVGGATGSYLADPAALAPFHAQLDTLNTQVEAAGTTRELAAALEALGTLATELDVLSDLLGSLPAEDPVQRTQVVEGVSVLYGRLNGVRARAEGQRRSLGSGELTARFAAQLALLAQTVTGALGTADTPEKAEEGLSRALLALEELEGQFGEYEAFLPDILARREETVEAFESRRQALLDERQRRAQGVADAADRILAGLPARAARLTDQDALNGFFAGDALVLKLRDLTLKLTELGDSVRAGDIEARLKAARDQALRTLRDRADLEGDGGALIRLGRHRFSVNTQTLDLTLLPRGDHLALHLTGTQFMEPLRDPALDAGRAFWDVTLESESPELSRAEFLAGEVLAAARAGQEGLTLDALRGLTPDARAGLVATFAAARYRQGFQRGVHDHDAALILNALLPLLDAAGPLVAPPEARALAAAFWAQADATWTARLSSARAVQALLGSGAALADARVALEGALRDFVTRVPLPVPDTVIPEAAAFLTEAAPDVGGTFPFTQAAADLNAALDGHLRAAGQPDALRVSLDALSADPAQAWTLTRAWLDALTARDDARAQARFVPEAVALRLYGDALRAQPRPVTLDATVTGLLSDHPRLQGGTLHLQADDLLARLAAHARTFLPGLQAFQAQRQAVLTRERARLRLAEFQPRPLTSFVRNRLITDVYLPLIGDNLAKQIGAAGDGKRSDLMGLLLLISPPGYGKTTLMEYVAHRLGLVFVRVNGPSLGHAVRSLDPAQAPDAASRQELEKLNLALEMGGNVMLYVDDIQHTHPEFLQKFIALTDGTRRIEGVWNGEPRTYDLRGRRFAVVMAGNPYTETGEVFRIPDMLANRADVYNLGDVLGGMEDAFLLSYVENSLTSNAVLAPLAGRDLSDVPKLVARAQGHEDPGELSHPYSEAELTEILATLRLLLRARDTLARVNAAYIASAAQADRDRTEPPFKLQGSYRNMNKIAEKLSPVMNDAELDGVISDHYRGEAQLLTTGAEENLLKLAELRGTLTAEQAARWAQIRENFARERRMGAADGDTGARMVAQLADIAGGLDRLRLPQPSPAPQPVPPAPPAEPLAAQLEPLLAPLLAALRDRPATPPVTGNPDPLTGVVTPLLTALASVVQGQQATNAAVQDLAEVIRRRQNLTRPVSAPSPSGGRREDR
ncbi:DNA repair ATPase [Deinococcus sp. RM]|uniref:DNA repair ATPase n=1 Tax=Deinococcus sp. RM TaxID=2316359 RepID=UPI003AB482BD